MKKNSKYRLLRNGVRDRSLGDEWLGWDGDLDRIEINVDAGRRVFLGFSVLSIVLLTGITLLVWYLIEPRLIQINIHLHHFVGLLLIGFILLLIACFGLTILSIVTGKNFLIRYGGKEISITFLAPMVMRLGNRFGISRDRMGNSFVKVSNSLIRATRKGINEGKLLILLPRCLQRSLKEKIVELGKKYKCLTFTVSGGELARKIIAEQQPSAVIGVACERDLVSGIQDTSPRIPVIGIPNVRPQGPCKNTLVDFNQVEDAIKFFLGQNIPEHESLIK